MSTEPSTRRLRAWRERALATIAAGRRKAAPAPTRQARPAACEDTGPDERDVQVKLVPPPATEAGASLLRGVAENVGAVFAAAWDQHAQHGAVIVAVRARPPVSGEPAFELTVVKLTSGEPAYLGDYADPDREALFLIFPSPLGAGTPRKRELGFASASQLGDVLRALANRTPEAPSAPVFLGARPAPPEHLEVTVHHEPLRIDHEVTVKHEPQVVRMEAASPAQPLEVRIVGMPAPVPVAQTVERDKASGAIKRTVTRPL
jgi:hypothetical protein